MSTPETDAYIGDQNEGLMTEGEFAMCEFARMIERDRNELRHKFETLEREIAAMREAIKEAYKIIDVLYMDALDNHKESWPRAREWMELWKEVAP